MTATSKHSGEPATSLQKSEFRRATLRLTAYYTAGIVLILALSSLFIVVLFKPPEQVVPSAENTEADIVLDTAVSLDTFAEHEARENLPTILAFVDLGVLLVSSFGAYFFARYTLRPVEEVYTLQERFVGSVAHELRTPLAVLKSGAESVLRHTREPAAYRAFITESLEEIDRMTRLSNDLLFLLKHKHLAASPQEPVDMAALVRQQVQHFRAYADEHQVALRVEAHNACVVHGSRDDLARLLQNLIKNAVDYNRPGGEVDVVLLSEGERAVLSICDTGVGIAEADLPHIFERFYKADSARTHTRGGTGLGLSIVKDIAEAHGGTVEATGRLGEGTTLTVRLPA